MTARISHDATLLRLCAGEPIRLQFQPVDLLGVAEDLTGRTYSLVVYTTAGAALFKQDGTIFNDTQGNVVEFLVGGDVTAKWRGTNIRLEIAEVALGGRDCVLSAQIVIDRLVPGVAANANKGIQLVNRVRRYFDIRVAGGEIIDVDVLRYKPDANGNYSLYEELPEVVVVAVVPGA